jgi:hypothetical protein
MLPRSVELAVSRIPPPAALPSVGYGEDLVTWPAISNPDVTITQAARASAVASR